MTSVDIAGRIIGPGRSCFIIGEAGVNHNGDRSIAARLVDEAARAKVDAVKFQTFSARRLALPDAPKADYQVRTTDPGESQFEMLRRLELPRDAHGPLMDACRERGLLFLSTPFDEESADFLEGLGVPAFKIPSGELTNLPFLRHVSRKGRPMIVSTGMATLVEVAQAVDVIRRNGSPGLVLLHCVSCYPAEPGEANLRAMKTLEAEFKVPVGYSDHTMGTEAALAAVALGACVVEKHFTLDRGLPGPDHRASLEPGELAGMVQGIRKVEAALGTGRKEPAAREAAVAAVARKSLVAAVDIAAGSRITADMVDARRPGTGIPPGQLDRVLGRRARRAIRKDAMLQEADLDAAGPGS